MRNGSVTRAVLRHGLPVSNKGRQLMLTKSILTATAIALVAVAGSASAGAQFETLDQEIYVAPLSSSEMSIIKGSTDLFFISNNKLGTVIVIDPFDPFPVAGDVGQGVCNTSGCILGGPLSTPRPTPDV